MIKQVHYDFVVSGAGLSGMVAAVTAARKGLKVALLNDRSVPGGNASSEIGVVIQGSSHHNLNYSIYAKETGILDELRSKLDYAVAFCGYDVAAACDAVFLDFLYDESNLDLYLNTVVIDTVVANDRICSVTAYQMKQDITYHFIAPLYADCTGDSVVAYKAGADISMGAEAKGQFREKSADDLPQTWTMGNTLYFEIEDVGHPVKFVRPKFAHDVAKMEFMKDIENPKKMRMLHVGGRFWTLEYGGQVNTISDNEHIQLELRKLVYGLWDYIKNSGKFPNAENFVIKRVYSVAGTRESRRVLGDYILTETDLDQAKHFPDAVLTGGWPMDLHAPKGIYDDLPASAFIPVTMVYDIPYRCLYSRNISNLLLAGRNISTTHIALSSTRVMGTCGAMGQAIGMAAWLCKTYEMLPKQLYPVHIQQLQRELLLEDQFIIGKQAYGDRKLEEAFRVCADSVQPYENTCCELEMGLEYPLGIALPVLTSQVDHLQIRIRNLSEASTELKADLLCGSRPESYVPEQMIQKISVPVPGSYDGWITVPVSHGVGEDQKLYLVFLPNENLKVFGSRKMLPGVVTSRFYKEKTSPYNHNTCPLSISTGYVGQDHLYRSFNLCFRNVSPSQDMFAAKNLLDGHVRPYGHMHMWLSKPVSKAKLFLQAETYHWVDRIELFFDNQLEDDIRRVIPAAMVKDLRVSFRTSSGEESVEITDHYQRRCIIPVKKYADHMEIELLNTYGDQRFGLYGIKIFGE